MMLAVDEIPDREVSLAGFLCLHASSELADDACPRHETLTDISRD